MITTEYLPENAHYSFGIKFMAKDEEGGKKLTLLMDRLASSQELREAYPNDKIDMDVCDISSSSDGTAEFSIHVNCNWTHDEDDDEEE